MSDNKTTFPMSGKNYKFMIIGLVLIFMGFILMIGGGTEDVNEFNEAIFGVQRLTIAPILIVLGFIVEIYAIMAKPNKTE